MLYKRFLAGEEVEIWPSRGTNAVPIAFNPNTGLIYASTWNLPRIQKLAPPKPASPRREHHRRRQPDCQMLQPGDVPRSLVADQSADRREEMGGPVDGLPELCRHAGDRRRTGVHRQVDAATSWRSTRQPARRSGNSRPARASIATAITYMHNGAAIRDRRVRDAAVFLPVVIRSDRVPTGGSI